MPPTPSSPTPPSSSSSSPSWSLPHRAFSTPLSLFLGPSQRHHMSVKASLIIINNSTVCSTACSDLHWKICQSSARTTDTLWEESTGDPSQRASKMQKAVSQNCQLITHLSIPVDHSNWVTWRHISLDLYTVLITQGREEGYVYPTDNR